MRIARKLAGELVSIPDRPSHHDPNELQSRGVLGELKVKKRGGVSTNRVGSARSNSWQGGSRDCAASNPTQQGAFQIFCDESDTPQQILPPQTSQWNSLPSREMKKENDRAAGVWTQARVSVCGCTKKEKFLKLSLPSHHHSWRCCI